MSFSKWISLTVMVIAGGLPLIILVITCCCVCRAKSDEQKYIDDIDDTLKKHDKMTSNGTAYVE